MALGFIGPLVKSLLAKRGYLITRPTQFELSRERSVWRQWLSRDPYLFADVYVKNREALARIPSWVTDDALDRSLWRYGVPAKWRGKLDLDLMDCSGLSDIEKNITSADLLAFLARHSLEKLNYLEIGVSVGKTLVQIHYQISGALLVGLDIEEINPVLRDQFDYAEEIWRSSESHLVNTLDQGKIAKTASCWRLSARNNVFDYISADEFRDDTWQRLRGHQFNVIFSDGVHSPEALRTELDNLIRNDLIDRDRFVMLWDDLWDNSMQLAFAENARCLANLFGRGDDSWSLYMMHGSYGPKRPMGLFSSF